MFRLNGLMNVPGRGYSRVPFVRWLSVAAGLAMMMACCDASIVADELTVREFRMHLETFVKQSKSKSPEVQRVAVFNLCQLHMALVTDPKFSNSLRLQGFRTTIQNRLEAYRKQVHKTIARENRERERRGVAAGQDRELDPSEPPPESRDLDAEAGESASAHPLLGPVREEVDLLIFDSLGMAYGSANQLAGGPATLFHQLGGRFGPPWDHGPELVALIETTIDPEFWRAGGGQGAISYYQPAQALVISASQEIHDRVYDLLIKLGARGG